MLVLLIVGGALLVGAAVLAFVGQRARRRVAAVADTRRSTCAELRGVAAASQGVLVELAGAGSTPSGAPLRSPLGDRDCVWYRAKITEHYRTWETRGTGSDRRRELVERTRVHSDESSADRFVVDDGTGTATVDPRQAHVDRPIETLDRMMTDDAGGWSRRLGLDIDFGLFNLGGGEGTIGFKHEEWILPVGRQLYVLGEARAEGDTAVVAKPPRGELLISTRREEEILRSARWRVRAFVAGAAVVAAAGIALLVVAFLV